MKTFLKKSGVLVIAILAGVISVGYGQAVPKTWLPGMRLEASYGGGMVQYSYNILITDSASHMIVNGGEKRYNKKFTRRELDELLAFLASHDFDKIEADHTVGFTNDKASETIMLLWDNNVVGASQSASSAIRDDQKDKFNQIQAYVEGLFQKKGKKK